MRNSIITKKYYNIPRACLPTRSPVPAMNLTSNISSLWRHMLETCCRLRTLCCKHSTAMSRDMIKLQLGQHFCRATWVSCRVGVTLCCDFYTFRSCNACTFSLTTFSVLRHTTLIFAAVAWYMIKHLFYETAWSILFWNHKNGVISLVKIHRDMVST